MSLKKYEKETIINFNDEENEGEIYTCNKSWMNKMDKLCNEFPSDFSLIKSDAYSKTYKLSKRLIRVVKPRYLSEEKRQELKVRALKNFHNV